MSSSPESTIPAPDTPYVVPSWPSPPKPATELIIMAHQKLMACFEDGAEVDFNMDNDRYGLRLNLRSARSAYWDKTFPIRVSTSLFYIGDAQSFDSETVPEPENYGLEYVRIFLAKNELARHTQTFRPPLYKPNSNIIEAGSTIKSRKEAQGKGFGTGLFATACASALGVKRIFPEDFLGKRIISHAYDVSEYRGKSTEWTSFHAQRLGYTNDPAKNSRENYWGEPRICRTWEKEV